MSGPWCVNVVLIGIVAMAGCAGRSVGPPAIAGGRPAYNAVINRTEDEQVLGVIVRQRYDDTFGLLAVSNVTASLRVGVTAGANAGIGPSENFAGNLVPLSAEATYEDNPTISYQPLSGEQFVQKMLAPLTGEQALLLARMSTDELEVLPLVVRRANGLRNPVYASSPTGPGFDRFAMLLARLREAGALDVVQSSDDQYQILLHGGPEEDRRALLETLGIGFDGDTASNRTPRLIPLRFFVGDPQTGGVEFETPSALEVIRAAAQGVEVPAPHIAAGVARTGAENGAEAAIIRIRSSPSRPDHAMVAMLHRGTWFYVDDRDARSKQAFMVIRTLIGMRLTSGQSAAAPVLTIPVAR